VIAVHKPTGIAVIVGVDDRSSQMKNRLLALARLAILVAATDVETDEWRAT
jgi:protein subunit release factor A